MFYANLLFKESRGRFRKLFFRFGRVKLAVAILGTFGIHFGMSFQIVFQAFCNILSLCNYTDMIRDVLPDFR